MIDQYDLIHDTDWDTLIVLDACRYDFFRDNYERFFEGDLIKAHSPVSHTEKWFSIMFPDKYDITIYSGNPRVRSKVRQNRLYFAGDHFTKVHDIWDKCWDKGYDTVFAKDITNYVVHEIITGEFKGKNIVWFLQPHYPYVGTLKTKYCCKDLRKGVLPQSTMYMMYQDNLDLSLEAVRDLLPHLDGEVYVTGDHGDVLCEPDIEDGIVYGHGYPNDIPELRDVPWLKVKQNGSRI